MSRAELVIVLAVVVEVTAFLAYLAGYDAGWNTKREPDPRMSSWDEIEGALRGD